MGCGLSCDAPTPTDEETAATATVGPVDAEDAEGMFSGYDHETGAGTLRVDADVPARVRVPELGVEQRLGKWVQDRFEKARPRHFWCFARLECRVGKVAGIVGV